MRWMLVLVSVLAAFAAHAAPARFDYYLLALSVAPAFCEDQPQRKQRLAQCRALSDANFRATPLTLHGLWPNRRDGRHPEYCGLRESRVTFCRLPPLPLDNGAQARLVRAMPAAADCLDRYEWAKHGSCSGAPEDAYFQAAVALTERVNRALGQTLARHAGQDVEVRQLRAVLQKRDHALADAVVFDCRTPRTPEPQKRRPMLREVRVYFERDAASSLPGAPMEYAVAGARSYQSGCAHGRAYIDSPAD